jgi:hypothetical protein
MRLSVISTALNPVTVSFQQSGVNMFYRFGNKSMLAVLMATLLGTIATVRAQEPARDLETQLKDQEAHLKELEAKLKSQAAADAKKTAAEAKERVDQKLVPTEAQGFGFASGQSPIRVRVQPSLADAIHSAAAEVRDAKGDDDRKAAQKKLDEALSKYFDDDMVQREKDLKQVEERVTKLHDLLEKRRSNKQEIIDLESKVVLNQANGLGFYDGDESGPGVTPGALFKGGAPFTIRTDGRSWGTSAYVPKVAPVSPIPPIKPVPPTSAASSAERPE